MLLFAICLNDTNAVFSVILTHKMHSKYKHNALINHFTINKTDCAVTKPNVVQV